MISPIIMISIQWAAIAILFFLLLYSSFQKPSEMQKHVTFLTITSILFLSGYLIRLSADNLQSAMIGVGVSYLGQPLLLLASLLLISTFFGFRIPRALVVVMVLFAAFISLSVFTNSYHYLFYATVEFNPDATYSPIITTHGPIYNLNLFVCLCYFVSFNIMILIGYRRISSPVKRSLAIYSVLMVISGMLGYVFYFLKLTGGYDSTMLGVSLGTVFLSVMFFRCRLFDIVDKAKDHALDHSSDGIIIYDDANSIVYKNLAADRVMSTDVPQTRVDTLNAGSTVLNVDSRYYSFHVQDITAEGEYLGKSVSIHDISEDFNHQLELEEVVRVTTDRLETVQRTIFGSMASIVEARSLETGDHIKRVSAYSEMIAMSLRRMGKFQEILTDEYISTLALSAPLHDIGKVSIPDAILLKPGKLTDEEFEVIKTHSQKGSEIINSTMKGLESEEYISMAAETAMYHHERWDGKGYPKGLAGSAIPLPARIVALADCFDAMTSKRCYKDAFPNEQAFRIIREECGTHFDPDVVEAFFLAQ